MVMFFHHLATRKHQSWIIELVLVWVLWECPCYNLFVGYFTHWFLPSSAPTSIQLQLQLELRWLYSQLPQPPTHPPSRRSTEWPLLQLLTLTTTSTLTSNLTELGTAQPQLVFIFSPNVNIDFKCFSWTKNKSNTREMTMEGAAPLSL